MKDCGHLEKLGVRKSRPLRTGAPEIGLKCGLCGQPFRLGDQIVRSPPDTEASESPVHWKCLEEAVDRARAAGPPAPGTTRHFLEACAAGECMALKQPEPEIAAFILKYGRPFEWRPLPRGTPKGRMRNCLQNAQLLALIKPRSYTYVEGYAINLVKEPVAHAWCADRRGFVVDPTWDEGAEYFGVPFRAAYVKLVGAQVTCGLIENEDMGFPLLTGEHVVEEAVLI